MHWEDGKRGMLGKAGGKKRRRTVHLNAFFNSIFLPFYRRQDGLGKEKWRGSKKWSKSGTKQKQRMREEGRSDPSIDSVHACAAVVGGRRNRKARRHLSVCLSS
mmetsp:Transcript_18888/g.38146  ORF Transcript_18888/g.38146 Transcript_18888/m.38146 type:complete len:104 (+) Transcript_18888:1613-1924(+)